MEVSTESPLLSSYDERWKKYRGQYKTCRMEFSEEAVHDLRVTARRMLAVLDIARGLRPHSRIQKARKDLKDVIEELDELRDVQVLLVEISENIEFLPELKSFQKSLKKREAKLLRSAYKHIKQKGLSEISKRIKKTRESLVELEQKGDAFDSRLIELVNNTYSLAEQAYAQVDAAQPSTIHSLRVAFRKFRYLAEITHLYVKNYPAENFERMHHYQDMMGNIQDVEVFLASFLEYVEEHAPDLKKDEVTTFYRKKLNTLVTDFMENKGELSVFWKHNPALQKEKGK
jgi:CHAD domain-containing protein